MNVIKIEYIYNGELFSIAIAAYSTENAIRWLRNQLGKDIEIRSHYVVSQIDAFTPESSIQVIESNLAMYERYKSDKEKDARLSGMDREIPNVGFDSDVDAIDPYTYAKDVRRVRESKEGKGWGNVSSLFARKQV